MRSCRGVDGSFVTKFGQGVVLSSAEEFNRKAAEPRNLFSAPLLSRLDSQDLRLFRTPLLGQLSQQSHPFGIVQDVFAIQQGNQFADDFPQLPEFNFRALRGLGLEKDV